MNEDAMQQASNIVDVWMNTNDPWLDKEIDVLRQNIADAIERLIDPSRYDMSKYDAELVLANAKAARDANRRRIEEYRRQHEGL